MNTQRTPFTLKGRDLRYSFQTDCEQDYKSPKPDNRVDDSGYLKHHGPP